MGFLNAINQSGWDAGRKADAGRLVVQMRGSLRRSDFPADSERVFNNMDSDELVPDVPPPGRPTSRLELLDELMKKGPPPREELKQAVTVFCREHKQEGPEDATAQGRVLGRVCRLSELNAAFKKARVPNLRKSRELIALMTSPSIAAQRDALAAFNLSDKKLMWSFYDPNDEADPFCSFDGNADKMVDRLGLGKDWNARHDLVKWGHRLPAGTTAHTATAWDGGADNPYWYPGGRTRPLSADGGGTNDGAIGPKDGVPEVVHDPVTGSQLTIPISHLAS